MISVLSTLLISIGILIYLWMKNRFNYWKKRRLETEPYSFGLGNIMRVMLLKESFADRTISTYNFFKSKGLKHGGWYLMWMPLYYPVDVDIIKNIMQADFLHFVDRGVYFNEKTDPLSAHLFSLEGKKWKFLRNKLSPTFTSGKMKLMHNTLVDCTRELFRVMDREVGNALDIKDIVGRYTTDVIGSCAFGLECNSLENPDSEFRKNGKAVFTRDLKENIKQFIIFVFPEFAKKFNTKVIPTEVSDFFMGVVTDTVAYRERNNVSRKDFMHLLIQLKNRGKLVDDESPDAENLTEDENKITLEEIAAQAFIFFEAGFETSSTTMTFCLYELAKEPELQHKVRKEIRRVFKKYGELTYEAAMDMHFLEQTINETLRKYPPLPSLQRICTKEYKVPGTDLVLEKGVKVMIPVIGIHHDPDYYPDPQKFDPDRFSEENKSTRPSFAFLPFGEGPRICIGLRFGMMQTKIGLIALLLNYEFSLNEKMKEPLEFDPSSFIMAVKGGVWLDFKKLSDQTVQL